MEGILVVERMILESLKNGMDKVLDISIDTGLNKILVQNIISSLVNKGLIDHNDNKYIINEDSKSEWLPIINNKNNVREEVKELFISFINQHFEEDIMSRPDFKLQKIWLTSSEEKIFKSLLYNMEFFIENLKQHRIKYPKGHNLGDQKVVFWGMSNYSALVEGIVRSV